MCSRLPPLKRKLQLPFRKLGMPFNLASFCWVRSLGVVVRTYLHRPILKTLKMLQWLHWSSSKMQGGKEVLNCAWMEKREKLKVRVPSLTKPREGTRRTGAKDVLKSLRISAWAHKSLFPMGSSSFSPWISEAGLER